MDPGRAVTGQAIRVGLWILSAASLIAGFYVGFNISANTGAFLLVASAVLALVPFATHRTQT